MMSINSHCLALTVAVVATLAPSAAVSSQIDAVLNCISLRDDVHRLTCFDGAAREIVAAIEASRSKHAPGPEPESEFPVAPAPLHDWSVPAETGISTAEQEASFGIERTDDFNRQRIDLIHSRIAGAFDGWDGSTRFELENGQVWEQIDSSRAVFKATGPRVTIKRGFFDSYILSVEGLNRSTRVRRIE